MRQKSVLVLAEVNCMLDAAQREAEANDLAVAIAVTDDGGHLLGLRRLDGAAPAGSYTAQHKARSAALGGKPTRIFEEMINGGRTAYLSVPELEGTMTGGIPVEHAGNIGGAIGVSGAAPDQDELVAKAGISALELE